jgi:6-phosphogluconolactonase (cycloisomerase 2 family)
MPISVTISGALVYVLNAGGNGNITGFTLSPQGDLAAIPGSTRPLSSAAPGPAQVQFNPAGTVLVVTEKNTNRIVTYAVQSNGVPSAPTSRASAGMTPFGFAFAGRDLLIVSEAFGGAANASATSSYVLDGLSFTVVTPSLGTTETAACWTVVTNDARYAYVTNTGSGTVTGYAVTPDGTLTLLNANGVTGVTGPGSTPIDAAFSVNSRFLYVLNAGAHTVSVFEIASDGGLSPLAGVSGLPVGAVGIAAH